MLRSLRTTLFVVALFSSTVVTRATNFQPKIDFQLDIAVLVDCSNGTSEEARVKMEKFINRLPDHFEFGEGKVRMAVHPLCNASKGRVNMTMDGKAIQNVKLPGSTSGQAAVGDLLREARSNVFADDPRLHAPNVIIFLTADPWVATKAAASDLVWTIFAGPSKRVPKNATRLYHIDDFVRFERDFGQWAAVEDMCKYEKACRFFRPDDECYEIWFQFRAHEVVGGCNNTNPDPKYSARCEKTKCTETCDRVWPWPEAGLCKFGHPAEVDVRRRDDEVVEPLRWMVDNCPRMKTGNCSPPQVLDGPVEVTAVSHGTAGLAPWEAALIGALVVMVLAVSTFALVVVVRNRVSKKKGVVQPSKKPAGDRVEATASAAPKVRNGRPSPIGLSPAPSPGAASPGTTSAGSKGKSGKRVSMAQLAASLKAVENMKSARKNVDEF